MRLSARAILITNENKLLFMRRFKPNTGEYYVTIGGGVEKGETSEQGNAMDFFVAFAQNRCRPTGTEWTKNNAPDNRYELVEVTLGEARKLNLKPETLKDKILDYCEQALNGKEIFF